MVPGGRERRRSAGRRITDRSRLRTSPSEYRPPPSERDIAGETEGYVRLSIGLEHIDDIIADLERGSKTAGA
jgi:cystathionine beta-lyase/cystathionine gamma-synthase